MIIKYRDILIFLMLWFGFFLIGLIFYLEYNFYSQEGIFLLQKAQLAIKGVPPRLENIGLVYPPLPYFIFLPLSFLNTPIAAIIVNSFWGALCITACVRYLRWVPGKLTYKILTTFAFILNPIFLYMMYFETSLIIYASFLLLFVYLFFRFYETRIPYYIVLSGVILGGLTAIRYDTFIITMLLVPFVPFLIYERGGEINLRRVFSLALMLTLPTMIILGSWIYINWIFQGDPFYFLYSPYSYFKQAAREISVVPDLVDAKGNFLSSTWIVIKMAFFAFPAFFVILGIIRTPILFIAAIIPILFQIVSIYLGLSAPSVTWFAALIPISIIIVYYYINSQNYNYILGIILIISMYVSIAFGFYTLINSNRIPENNFSYILLDKVPEDMFAQEKQVTEFLKMNVKENQPILIDDALGYPIVCFFGDPSQFYLPYQYDYFKYLQQPAFFAQYIVVPRPELTSTRFDQLTSIHPESFSIGFDYTTLAFQTKDWRVYKSTVFGINKELKL